MNRKLIVLLLPGLDGNGRQFRRLVECAPEHLQPQVVSYPGDEVLDYSQLESLVRGQLPDEPYLLVGESLSGPVAVSLASRSSENLRGLVLAASFVTPPALRLRRFMAPRDEELVDGMREAIRCASPAVLAARVRATLSVDKRQELAAVKCPLLYLHANRDTVVSRRCLRQILEVRPDLIVEWWNA